MYNNSKLLFFLFIFLFINIFKSSVCVYLFSACSKYHIINASKNNTVVISAVSSKYIDQIQNFWLSSAIPNNFTSIIFIASDFISYKFCKSITKNSFVGETIVNQKEDAKFMSKDHVKITVSRLKMIHFILSLKISVFVIDLDIYLFKNPLPYIIKYNEDIVASIDRPKSINVGF